MSRLVVVKAALDREAGVFNVESSDLFGLNVEAPTLESLMEKLPGVVADLLCEDPDYLAGGGGEVPIELIAHATVRSGVAAVA